jgi:hypothetical protein
MNRKDRLRRLFGKLNRLERDARRHVELICASRSETVASTDYKIAVESLANLADVFACHLEDELTQ